MSGPRKILAGIAAGVVVAGMVTAGMVYVGVATAADTAPQAPAPVATVAGLASAVTATISWLPAGSLPAGVWVPVDVATWRGIPTAEVPSGAPDTTARAQAYLQAWADERKVEGVDATGEAWVAGPDLPPGHYRVETVTREHGVETVNATSTITIDTPLGVASEIQGG